MKQTGTTAEPHKAPKYLPDRRENLTSNSINQYKKAQHLLSLVAIKMPKDRARQTSYLYSNLNWKSIKIYHMESLLQQPNQKISAINVQQPSRTFLTLFYKPLLPTESFPGPYFKPTTFDRSATAFCSIKQQNLYQILLTHRLWKLKCHCFTLTVSGPPITKCEGGRVKELWNFLLWWGRLVQLQVFPFSLTNLDWFQLHLVCFITRFSWGVAFTIQILAP